MLVRLITSWIKKKEQISFSNFLNLFHILRYVFGGFFYETFNTQKLITILKIMVIKLFIKLSK